MLAIDVIERKPINNINGEDIVDLTVSSMSSDGYGDLNFVNIIQCPYALEMRPDLLSKLYLGDQNRMGMLLKLNGISNPFSLEAGDIFLIPSITSANSMLANNTTSDRDTNDKFSFKKKLEDRISKISDQRKEYLRSRAISAAANSSVPLPPNVATEDQFEVKDGKLVFGSSIGNCKTNIAENKSKATIKARLAQRNIFGS